MLKFNKSNSIFEPVAKSTLKENNILERYNLQKSIISSWELFKNELGLPSAFLIGEEITPDSSTQNSLDLLAYDSDDSSLVVIELKRDKNKLQLLQAVSYAAMVSKWNKEKVIEQIEKHKLDDYEELLGIVKSNDLNTDIKIILIAESFDPEVIVTADWLTSFSVSIYAYALDIHRHGDESFLTVDQRYPLRELSDAYEPRKSSRKKINTNVDVSWDDVIAGCEYDFAGKAIAMCQKIKAGDPSRKRFLRVKRGFDKFDNITFFFRNKYVNVYLLGGDAQDFDYVQGKFSTEIKISAWRDGLSLIIETEQQFKELCALDKSLNY